MSNQFVKNTDAPSQDSPLWKFADDWKVSGKTGQAYASLPGVERQDTYLHENLSALIKSGTIDDIEYQSYFFVPTFFDSRDPKKPKSKNVVSNWHVFCFPNAQESRKKVEELKKFANYTPKTTTVPKTQPVEEGQKTLNIPTTPISIPKDLPPHPNIISSSAPQYLITFTDPVEVDGNDQQTILKLVGDGFCYLPTTLVKDNMWRETLFDDDGNVTGTNTKFFMGRIINVKIADN